MCGDTSDRVELCFLFHDGRCRSSVTGVCHRIFWCPRDATRHAKRSTRGLRRLWCRHSGRPICVHRQRSDSFWGVTHRRGSIYRDGVRPRRVGRDRPFTGSLSARLFRRRSMPCGIFIVCQRKRHVTGLPFGPVGEIPSVANSSLRGKIPKH